MAEFVIGVDGGNSKTDIVVAGTDGTLLARFRGPGMPSPLTDLDRWRATLRVAVARARSLAGVTDAARAGCAAYFLANVDLPEEFRLAEREIARAHHGSCSQMASSNRRMVACSL